MTEWTCIGCDDYTIVDEHDLCEKCSSDVLVCQRCEETKPKKFMFQPNEDGEAHCKDCAECKYCKNEKKTGDLWCLECDNPDCLFYCRGCEEMKHTKLKNENGLYKDVCTDCSACELCGDQMWDYICRCRV